MIYYGFVFPLMFFKEETSVFTLLAYLLFALCLYFQEQFIFGADFWHAHGTSLFTLVFSSGLLKSKSGATKRKPHLETLRDTW